MLERKLCYRDYLSSINLSRVVENLGDWERKSLLAVGGSVDGEIPRPLLILVSAVQGFKQ